MYKYKASFFTLLILLVFTSCENDLKEVAALNRKQIQVEEGKNISTYLSQEGRMKAHLMAPLMLSYRTDSPYIDFPKGVLVNFYKDSLVIESVTRAKYAKYFEGDKKVLLKDSVVVYNKISGDTLWTNLLWWDQGKGTFYTDEPCDVFFKANDQKLHGKNGIDGLQNFTRWTLHTTTGSMNVPADLHP